MRKVRFSDECSPSKIPVPSPNSKGNDMSASRMEVQRRIELDNETIQITSPLSRIELREKSVPGIGSLYGIESGTIAPLLVRKNKIDPKTESIQATEEVRPVRKQASQDMASWFGRSKLIQDMPPARRIELENAFMQSVQTIRRIKSMANTVQDVEPTRTIEPVDSSFRPPIPIQKVKPANIIIPTMRPLRRSDSEETIVPAPLNIRSDSEKTIVPTTPVETCRPSEETIVPAPLKMRRDSEKTIVPTTPVETCRPFGETIVQSPIGIQKSPKDNVSPTLRKMRSAIRILSPSPRAALKDLRPEAISLLRAMCFFNPTDIRVRYLEAICARYSSEKGKFEATLSDFPVQVVDLQSTLNELKQIQLITSPANALGIRIKAEIRHDVLKQLKNTPEIFEVGFATAVFVLYELWPSMMGPYRSEGPQKDEGPQKREPNFDQYAKDNLWGGRDDLVIHVTALEALFNKAKDVTRERCASRRYMVLLVEAAWYYYERVQYPEANQMVGAAYQTSKLACMVPKSLLANLHRTSAAIASETGDIDRVNREVEEFTLLYPESFPQARADAIRTWHRGCPTADWAWTENAILQSGLLAAAPDGVGLSPWGFDEVEGFRQLAPFLSLRYFGWMNYAEGRYVDAARCFLQCLGDRRRVFGSSDSVGPQRGELLYALGVVFKAQNKDQESFNYFKRALAQFKSADEDGPGKAKTHYKLALHYLNTEEVSLADDHIEAAAAFYIGAGIDNEYVPQIARLCFQCTYIAHMTNNGSGIIESLNKANEWLDKISSRHRRQQSSCSQVTMFDAEVVIWAR